MKWTSILWVIAAVGFIFLAEIWVNNAAVSDAIPLGITLTPSEIAPTDPPTATPQATATPAATATVILPTAPAATATPEATPTVILPTSPAATATIAVPTPTQPSSDSDSSDGETLLPSAGEPPFAAQAVPAQFTAWLLTSPLPARPSIDLSQDQRENSPILRVSIVEIAVDAVVVPINLTDHRWNIDDLHTAAGWLAETSLPGQGGNTVLTAHVTTKKDEVPPFWGLWAVADNSLVVVETEKALYTYQVRGQKVIHPNDLSVLDPGLYPQVTLITCTDWDENARHYRSRRVVVAELVEVKIKTQ